MKRLIKHKWKGIIAYILCIGILLQSVPVYALAAETDSYVQVIDSSESGNQDLEITQDNNEEIQENSGEIAQEPIISEEPIIDEEQQNGSLNDQSAMPDNEDQQQNEEIHIDYSNLYQDGIIKIYNLKQLSAIGSGQTVKANDNAEDSFGTGEEICENGTAVTYSLDGKYQIMNDIPLDNNAMWTLPEGFTGTFQGQGGDEKSPLYDVDKNIIYIYNNYQLLTIASENAEKEPVMTNDMVASEFGIGQFVYADGTAEEESNEENRDYLTYSSDHTYVLSSSFSEKMPELKAQQYAQGTATDEQKAGRSHVGQVYTEIDGEKYILIGNEQQLRAIGTDKQVAPMLFVRTEVKFLVGLISDTTIIPYYPGDADLNVTNIDETGITYTGIENDTKEFQYLKDSNKELWGPDFEDPGLLEGVLNILDNVLSGVLSIVGSVDSEIVGLKNENTADPSIGKDDGKDWGSSGEPEFVGFEEIKSQYQGLKYSSDANYIIFRDINLSEGSFSDGKDNYWDPIHFSGTMEGRKNMAEGAAPIISNIKVYKSSDDVLNLETDIGFGFFGTISNNWDSDSFTSKEQVSVKNLQLDQVTVDNNATQVNQAPGSLIEGVLGLLGGLVGEIVTGITSSLPILGNLTLGKVIEDLLTLKQNSPDLFASGAFAGRVIGDVSIENCKVTNADVSNAKGMTGGFIGYSEGETTYDALSGIVGDVVTLLSNLLNIIPGVGLGDLITVLLENDVPLGRLIPKGYYNPVISGCSVSLSDGMIGKDTTDYNGGFIGVQIGTETTQCAVEGLKSVSAKNYAGGFAGVERDAQIKGLLTDLGVELVNFDISSKQTECEVSGTDISIKASEQYAGGMNGVMANSKSTGAQISSLTKVSANKYAGGFAGRATIGYGFSIGKDDSQKGTLANSVSSLLEKLLNGENEEKLSILLSLSGAQSSEIAGANISGTNLTVESVTDYAGGLIGQGDGTKITANGQQTVKISGLNLVKANNYAGGIAGSLVTANPIGVLNSTVGVGSYLPFTLSAVNLNGSNLKIEAIEKYAAGGVGLALGGIVDNVNINYLETVTAGNYAGGFAGRSGSGALVKESGLDLLGLGLVKVDNLLSLAEGAKTTISSTQISGTESGITITANGNAQVTDGESILAGGFIAEANGIQIDDSNVVKLKSVQAIQKNEKESYAGGFIGRSHTGGLAGIAQEEIDGILKLPEIADVNSLLKLVPYLIPTYESCTVQYVSNGSEAQVDAQYAGGFFGYMQSGTVDNSQLQELYSVYGLEYIKGTDYAGGFAGKVDAGAVAASDGLTLLGGVLKLNISALLSVLNVYIPYINSAGVKSAEQGFIVEATAQDSSAGGYIGYGSGVKISNSDVTSLKHTKVTPPSDSLESVNAPSYFDENSSYAVKGGKYAGGYIGCVDIDSAAGVGEGLGLLDGAISIGDVLSALDVVASSIENSDVNGSVGGYAVLANGQDSQGNVIGMAGGYAGRSSGTQIKNSDALNFSYIIGQETAGGYVGLLEPGNVASVLENGNILNGLLDVNNLAQVVQAFIPIIEGSQTTSIPCGGAVRADGLTDGKVVRGMAGGFVGYNHGGRIVGTTGTEASGIVAPGKECAVIRLRSVYGGEFAGGFTGLMENASIADTGNLKLLFGLVSASNVLGLLQAVYPTETNTAVYGPLRKLDLETWNAWAEAVASDGVYGYQFPSTPVNSEDELQQLIKKYAYGYNVKAGRSEPASLVYQAGVAGGYAGRISGGVVTEAHVWDAKDIIAYQSSGGFAGEMITEGVAQVGSTSLLGLPLTGTLSVLQTFVPVIRNSDVTGYQSGMSVKATGIPKGTDEKIEKVGYAGGFVGHMVGGQIWGNWNSDQETGISSYSATDAVTDPNNDRCFVANLRQVNGTNAVGGFAGLIDPGSAAALDTSSSSGLLGGLLQKLIGTPGVLLDVLNATLSTVRAVDVKAWDSYGITIHGAYTNESANTSYAKAVGGFAGEINGAVIGDKDDEQLGVNLENVRSVTGGEHAGGFFGLADVSAVAELTGEGSTSILEDLISLDSVDVLDAFRTYIYDSTVSGTAASGLEVNARDGKSTEYVNNKVYTGNAGGFGGTLLNGTVKGCKVENLRQVNALNYAGGFVGHLGKSGVVDLDSLGVFDKLVSVGAGVLDIFGSYVVDSTVSGLTDGYTVKSENQSQDKSEIAGGFAGYADLAKLDRNAVHNLKQVASGEIAGGFAGKTSFAYLADIKADSYLVNKLIDMLNTVLKALWIADLQEGNIIKIDLGILTVDALYDGNLVHLNLLGLDIKIALAKENQLATIYIGDSMVEVSCAEDGSIEDDTELKNEINIQLIKANRTRISECSVTGVSQGYDVYGGGAGNKNNGSGENGYAGGFVGYNNEGLLKNNNMYYADVIRGTKGITGPFTGSSSLESNWSFNTLSGIEGEGNQYRIYRETDSSYNTLKNSSDKELQDAFETTNTWNVYTITHMATGKVEKFTDLKEAVMSSGSDQKPLNAYMEDGAMAVLMNQTDTSPTEPGDESLPPDVQDPCTDTVKLHIQKVWKNDKDTDRPEQIILHITRSYKDSQENTIADTQFNQEVILNKSDYQSEDTWEKILSGEPYTAYHVGENGEKYYYTYTVSEDALDGYKTKISYSGEYQYNIKIINEKSWFDSLLPETGGMGTAWIYTVGVLLLCFVAAMEYKKRKSKRRQSSYK